MTDPRTANATTERSYAGVPAHERIATRRARLIEAGRHLFGTKGVAATTVRGTCEAAGLSQRYFYESFSSVEALALAVADEIAEAVTAEAVRVAESQVGARTRAVSTFKTLIDFIAADPAAGRIMFIETAGNGLELAAWRRATVVRGATIIEDLLRRSADGASGGEGGRSRDEQIAALVMSGGAVETIVAWLEGEVDATPDQLALALARAVGAGPE